MMVTIMNIMISHGGHDADDGAADDDDDDDDDAGVVLLIWCKFIHPCCCHEDYVLPRCMTRLLAFCGRPMQLSKAVQHAWSGCWFAKLISCHKSFEDARAAEAQCAECECLRNSNPHSRVAAGSGFRGMQQRLTHAT